MQKRVRSISVAAKGMLDPNPTIHLQLTPEPDFSESSLAGIRRWLEAAKLSVIDHLQATCVGAATTPRLFRRGTTDTQLRIDDLSETAWFRGMDELSAGSLSYVEIELRVPGQIFGLVAELDAAALPGLKIAIPSAVVPDWNEGPLQQRLLTLLLEGYDVPTIVTGYITLDEAYCPYEVVMDLQYDNRGQLADHLRGYYWANLLTEGHLRVLGGIEQVKSSAPCFDVIRLPTGDAREAACLQLSASLSNYTDDQLRALRDYFDPLLLRGVPRTCEDIRAQVRVFQD